MQILTVLELKFESCVTLLSVLVQPLLLQVRRSVQFVPTNCQELQLWLLGLIGIERVRGSVQLLLLHICRSVPVALHVAGVTTVQGAVQRCPSGEPIGVNVKCPSLHIQTSSRGRVQEAAKSKSLLRLHVEGTRQLNTGQSVVDIGSIK